MPGGFEVSLRMQDAQNRMPELINATRKQLDTHKLLPQSAMMHPNFANMRR